jgi:predicted RNase H-like HicB family nuclease
MKKQKWVVVVEKAKGNYSAYAPGLDGCVATGPTITKTISNMKVAIKQHLALQVEDPNAEPSSVVAVDIVSI